MALASERVRHNLDLPAEAWAFVMAPSRFRNVPVVHLSSARFAFGNRKVGMVSAPMTHSALTHPPSVSERTAPASLNFATLAR